MAKIESRLTEIAEELAVLQLLVERIEFDAGRETVAVTFRPTGIRAVAEEVKAAEGLPARRPNGSAKCVVSRARVSALLPVMCSPPPEQRPVLTRASKGPD